MCIVTRAPLPFFKTTVASPTSATSSTGRMEPVAFSEEEAIRHQLGVSVQQLRREFVVDRGGAHEAGERVQMLEQDDDEHERAPIAQRLFRRANVTRTRIVFIADDRARVTRETHHEHDERAADREENRADPKLQMRAEHECEHEEQQRECDHERVVRADRGEKPRDPLAPRRTRLSRDDVRDVDRD